MLINKRLNQNVINLIFFLIIYYIGFALYKDYGIYLDDTYQRNNANFWYKYVKSLILDPSLSFNIRLNDLISGDIKTINSSTLPSLQPTPLGIFCELFIDFFNINNSQSVYQTRHLYNFSIFFVGLLCFYKLIYVRFNSRFYSYLGVVLLFITPRFFAESFYNSQDIYFLTLTIINIFMGFKFLKNPCLFTTLTFSISSALAFDTRIIGALSIILIISFFILKCFRSNFFYKKNFIYFLYLIFFIPFFILLFWPFLWANPFTNFITAFSELSSPAFSVTNFYLGKYVNSTYVPWHYHIVWILITTPFIVIFLFSIGSFFLIKRFFNRLIAVNDKNNDVWRGNKEMFDIYFFALIFFSIIIFINTGLGYTGWRHLYFIYPSIILISLYGFYYIGTILNFKVIKFLTYFFLIINVTYLAYWNFVSHPYQYVFFNHIFKKNFNKNFDMDYWGLSNKTSIEYIIKKNKNFPIVIGTKSFSSLEKSSLIFSNEDRKKISITHNLDNADFVITNYMPKNKDFIIDENKYEKYYEVIVDNIPINTVYKKINGF